MLPSGWMIAEMLSNCTSSYLNYPQLFFSTAGDDSRDVIICLDDTILPITFGVIGGKHVVLSSGKVYVISFSVTFGVTVCLDEILMPSDGQVVMLSSGWNYYHLDGNIYFF